MIRDVLRAFSLLSPAMRLRWTAQIPLAVSGAVAETLGAAAVLGLLQVIGDPAKAARLPIASVLYPHLASHDPGSVIRAFTAGLAVVYLLRYALLLIAAWLTVRLLHDSTEELSARLLDTYLEAPYGHTAATNTATLIQRVQRGAEATAERVYASALQLVTEILVAAGLGLLVAYVAPRITALAVAATLALLILPALAAGSAFRRWARREQDAEKSLLKELQQTLGSLKEIKVAAREAFFETRFRDARRRLGRFRRKRSTLTDALRLSVETAFVIVLLLVVAFVTWRGGTGPDLVALLGLYAYAGFRLVPSANRISLHLGNIRSGLPFAADLAGDLMPALRPPRDDDGAGIDWDDRSTIAFDDVSYEYEADGATLRDVRLVVRAGEWIGIVGPTGAGKSTLVDVLLGVHEPSCGAVRVNGRNIQRVMHAWRRLVGYVPQTFYLLDDSVRQNVAFGVPPSEIREDWVRRALDMARLTDVVRSLPHGLDTVLGERGTRLSGGQRQRIAIARALYHDPPILVFDEATAALDAQTESEVTHAIEGLQRTKTAFIIAHRLATVRRCDRIVVLDGGRITAVGTYDELAAHHSVFRTLAQVGDRPARLAVGRQGDRGRGDPPR